MLWVSDVVFFSSGSSSFFLMKLHFVAISEILSLSCNGWVAFMSCFSFILSSFMNHYYHNFVLSIIVWVVKVFGSKNQKNVELYCSRFTLIYFKRRNFI